MKNISQYNWNWWFIISIFLLFSTLFTATVINGNGWVTVAIIVTFINMLYCLYIGGMDTEEDLTDDEIREAFKGLMGKEILYTKEQVKTIAKNYSDFVLEHSLEVEFIDKGISDETVESLKEQFDKEKWFEKNL